MKNKQTTSCPINSQDKDDQGQHKHSLIIFFFSRFIDVYLYKNTFNFIIHCLTNYYSLFNAKRIKKLQEYGFKTLIIIL